MDYLKTFNRFLSIQRILIYMDKCTGLRTSHGGLSDVMKKYRKNYHLYDKDEIRFTHNSKVIQLKNFSNEIRKDMISLGETGGVLKYGRDLLEYKIFDEMKDEIDDSISDLLRVLPTLKMFYNGYVFNFDVSIVFYNSVLVNKTPEDTDDIKYYCVDEVINSYDNEIILIKFLYGIAKKYHTFFTTLKVRRILEYANLNYPDVVYNYKMSRVASYFDILSDDGVFLPYAMIRKRYKDKSFFIRPDSSNKTFPGVVVKAGELSIFEQTYKVNDETLCFVSGVKNIVSEKRTFIDVDNKKIISSSVYYHGYDISIDFDVTDAVNKILFENPNSNLYRYIVADFALLEDGSIGLIEFNSPHTSGFYNCDFEKISRTMVKNK